MITRRDNHDNISIQFSVTKGWKLRLTSRMLRIKSLNGATAPAQRHP